MVVFNLLRQRFHLFFQSGELLRLFLDLTPPAQQVAVIFKCASGHGSARAEQFSVQSDQPKGIMILSCDPDGGINILNHHGPSQEVSDEIRIMRIILDNLRSKAYHAVFVQYAFLPKFPAVLHRCQRQECRPAEPVLLQECDHPLGGLFIGSDDILNASAKRGLYGELVSL